MDLRATSPPARLPFWLAIKEPDQLLSPKVGPVGWVTGQLAPPHVKLGKLLGQDSAGPQFSENGALAWMRLCSILSQSSALRLYSAIIASASGAGISFGEKRIRACCEAHLEAAMRSAFSRFGSFRNGLT